MCVYIFKSKIAYYLAILFVYISKMFYTREYYIYVCLTHACVMPMDARRKHPESEVIEGNLVNCTSKSEVHVCSVSILFLSKFSKQPYSHMKILWVALKKKFLGLEAKERKDSVSQNLLEGMKGDNRQCVGFPARSMHLHFKEHFFIFPLGESVHWCLM